MNQADVKVSFYLKKSEADAKSRKPLQLPNITMKEVINNMFVNFLIFN